MTRASSPLTRFVACAALAASAITAIAATEERAYLSKPEIQASLIGKGIVLKNLASGKLSHWEFHPDGRVVAVSRSGLGSASGTWSIRDDGQMCVSMLGRTGCRYWFRKGNALANADSRTPDAQTVAEVSFD
ncbi:hypothetical protein ACIPRI_21330 [Variovorax sp. LARHSF232]